MCDGHCVTAFRSETLPVGRGVSHCSDLQVGHIRGRFCPVRLCHSWAQRKQRNKVTLRTTVDMRVTLRYYVYPVKWPRFGLKTLISALAYVQSVRRQACQKIGPASSETS